MKADIKDKWLNALRSGDYKQCTGRLHKGEGFCCLGVLTDLYAKEKGLEWHDSSMTAALDEGGAVYSLQGERNCLSTNIMEWAGLSSDYAHTSQVITDLIKMNDSGESFFTISNAIEVDL